jgi:hypothetical protein
VVDFRQQVREAKTSARADYRSFVAIKTRVREAVSIDA